MNHFLGQIYLSYYTIQLCRRLRTIQPSHLHMDQENVVQLDLVMDLVGLDLVELELVKLDLVGLNLVDFDQQVGLQVRLIRH